MMSPPILAQAWPFVHPGIAAAALAAALIPVLIHLINRRRFQKIPWAAMSFLVAANRRSARRVRLEHFILLALRMALVAAAGMAVARPFFSNETLGLSAARVHRIILLDNSLSMQAARADGRTRFEAAQFAAQKLLGSFPPGDGVSVITTAQPADMLIASPTYDRRLAKETLSAIPASHGVDDMAGALEAAGRILAESDAAPNNRALYLISDFPQRVWHNDAGSQPSAAARRLAEIAGELGHSETNLNLARVDPGTGENLAITEFRLETTLLSVQVPASFVVKVTNFGAATVRGATLELRRGSQTLRREALPPLASGEAASTIFSTGLASPGSKLLEARVASSQSDALPVDDVRWLSVEARESVPILIVDGQPGARLIDGQAGYLAIALAPRDEASQRQSANWGRTAANLYDVKVISEPELGPELSRAYDVIALCNVSRLAPQQWAGLQRFVSAGGGVFVSLGGLVSVENYNRFGFDEGRGILPARLERVQEAAPSAARLGFQLGDDAHALFDDFSNHHASGLFSARVDRYFALSEMHATAEVPLRYTNNDPALVISRVEGGRTGLWTTTTNMEWNNLPGRGDFVAVMAKAIGALIPQHGEHRNLLVGQTLVERLNPAESSMAMKVTWGDGPSAQPSIIPVGNDLAAQFGPVLSARPVVLTIGEEQRDFAVNVDPQESALQSAEPSAIAAAVGVPLRWMSENELPELAAPGSVEWAGTLMWVVVGLLLVEVWVAQKFAAPLPAREKVKERRAARAGVRSFSGATSP